MSADRIQAWLDAAVAQGGVGAQARKPAAHDGDSHFTEPASRPCTK